MSTEQRNEEESRLWETIQTFEQILELFPEDAGALESLALAYEQAGDVINAQESLLRLLRLMAAGKQWEQVHALASRVLALNPGNSEARHHCERAVRRLGNDTPSAAGAGGEATLSFDLQGERELGGYLQQHGLISRDQCERACRSLEENWRRGSDQICLTLLSEFEAMEGVEVEAVVDFLTVETHTAFVDVGRYKIGKEVADLLPLEQCRSLGVMPFAAMGGEIMAVGLNPLAHELRQALTEHLGTKVHFYLTSPRAFQAAVERRG